MEAALEATYAAFANVPKPKHLEASPYVKDHERLHRLVTLPLRQLSADDVGWYGSKALYTVGNAQDFGYFLPAVLEHSLQGNWPDPEIVFGKATQIPLSRQQRAALEHLLYAWWDVVLSTGEAWDVVDVLSSAFIFGLDWQTFLEHWDMATGLSQTLTLARFICTEKYKATEPEQFNAHLRQSDLPLALLKQWVERRETVERLEQAFFEVISPKEQALLSEAHAILSWQVL